MLISDLNHAIAESTKSVLFFVRLANWFWIRDMTFRGWDMMVRMSSDSPIPYCVGLDQCRLFLLMSSCVLPYDISQKIINILTVSKWYIVCSNSQVHVHRIHQHKLSIKVGLLRLSLIFHWCTYSITANFPELKIMKLTKFPLSVIKYTNGRHWGPIGNNSKAFAGCERLTSN